MTLSCKGPIASLLMKLLIMTLSQEFIIFFVRVVDLYARWVFWELLEKINALFEVTLWNTRLWTSCLWFDWILGSEACERVYWFCEAFHPISSLFSCLISCRISFLIPFCRCSISWLVYSTEKTWRRSLKHLWVYSFTLQLLFVCLFVCLFVWVPNGGLRGICCSQGRRYLGPNGTEMAAIKIQVQLTPLPVSCASQTSSV